MTSHSTFSMRVCGMTQTAQIVQPFFAGRSLKISHHHTVM